MVVVVLHLRAYLHQLSHVRCLWRHDVQEGRPANVSLLTAFHTLFCLFARFFAFLRFFTFYRLRKTGPAFLNESAALRE